MFSCYSKWHIEEWGLQQAKSIYSTTTWNISEDFIFFVSTQQVGRYFCSYIQIIIFEISWLTSKDCNCIKHILKWHVLKCVRQITTPGDSPEKKDLKSNVWEILHIISLLGEL